MYKFEPEHETYMSASELKILQEAGVPVCDVDRSGRDLFGPQGKLVTAYLEYYGKPLSKILCTDLLTRDACCQKRQFSILPSDIDKVVELKLQPNGGAPMDTEVPFSIINPVAFGYQTHDELFEKVSNDARLREQVKRGVQAHFNYLLISYKAEKTKNEPKLGAAWLVVTTVVTTVSTNSDSKASGRESDPTNSGPTFH